MARLYDLLADCVENRRDLPRRIGAGPWVGRTGENLNRQVKAALRDGLMVGHYPIGEASCELTDKGREIGEQVLAARRAREDAQ